MKTSQLKRIFIGVLTVFLLVSMSGCGDWTFPNEESDTRADMESLPKEEERNDSGDTCTNTSSSAVSEKDTATTNRTFEHIPAPQAYSIEGVPIMHQFPDYPSGCESVSAVMALQHADVSVSVDEFIDQHLPMSSRFYWEDGKNYGPSPYEHFIGSPRSTASYGCMAPVIEKALTSCLGNKQRVKDVGGYSLSELCEQYVSRDIPVLVWVTIKMIEIQPTNSWYLSDGTRFTWPGNEHCMVLVGYDENNYYFNDPYVGATVSYKRARAETRYAQMGKQALVILPK